MRSEVGITSQPPTACGFKPPAAGNLLRNWRGSEGLSLVSTSERTSTAYLQELPAACFLRKMRSRPGVHKYCVGQQNKSSRLVRKRPQKSIKGEKRTSRPTPSICTLTTTGSALIQMEVKQQKSIQSFEKFSELGGRCCETGGAVFRSSINCQLRLIRHLQRGSARVASVFVKINKRLVPSDRIAAHSE